MILYTFLYCIVRRFGLVVGNLSAIMGLLNAPGARVETRKELVQISDAPALGQAKQILV